MTAASPRVADSARALTNEQRLAAVATLLDPEAAAAKPHPRAAVFLIRRALEEHLDAYVRQRRPGLERCSMLTKTVWLAQHLDPAHVGRLAAVWLSLSRACHHHQYAMAPTISEILGWQADVEHVLAAIA